LHGCLSRQPWRRFCGTLRAFLLLHALPARGNPSLPFQGGDLYTLLAFSLLIVTLLGPRFAERFVRLVQVGVVAGTCFVATAAPQLLPMHSYIGLTERGGGLSLAESLAPVHEIADPMPTIAAVVAMALGWVWLIRKGEHRVALWLGAIVLLGTSAATVPAVYETLWRYVPGFRYQRIPERALVLVGLAAPPLIGAGVEAAWRWLGRSKPGALLALAGVVWLVGEAWGIAPAPPPMADPRREREENYAMRWLAEHADGSRVHVWESPDRHWGAEHITRIPPASGDC
jgi:hypothetical protein